ncbi:uncharacterized protein BDW47DRAFT_61958 [Aspergillus candidus]|uniref:Uncharacterized protein n=1 Tax=Aspergillus candidus TaxID=41067 RepID=A0A2I2F4J3_ASPCN|nr:hypothetical protein BDW47DRAFT_61958 [Aspergillus candidus]PLB35559.1 hypothetical protein BDW47DRAFT_61958 [Aspergillus candidus]
MAVPEFRAILPPIDGLRTRILASPPLDTFSPSVHRLILHVRFMSALSSADSPGSLLVPTPGCFPAVSRLSSLPLSMFPSLIHRLCRRWKSRRLIFGWLMILICCFISAILFPATCLSATKTRQDQFVVPFHPFPPSLGAWLAMRCDLTQP